MEVLPIGVGGAFTEKFYHNNYVFGFSNSKLLVDAGTTLRYSLKKSYLKVTDITHIFITHFHSDHVGGLEEFLQRCYFRLENGVHTPHKPTLLVTDKQKDIYYNELSIGLKNNGLSLDDYCNVVVIPQVDVDKYAINQEDFYLEVIDTSDLHCEDMLSYAIKITEYTSNKNIVFTSDIKHLQDSGIINLIDEYTHSIYQDIQFFHVEKGVHAEFSDILDYYPQSLYPKIYMMHYTDEISKYLNLLKRHNFKLVKQGKTIFIE